MLGSNIKKWHEQFVWKVTSSLKERYASSPQWKNGKFENLIETSMDMHFSDLPEMLHKQYIATAGRNPKNPLDIIPFSKQSFLSADQPTFIWYGHSVVLMRLEGKTILIDPMLGPNASPIAPFTTPRYSKNSLDLIDDFPQIDICLITHDHYDHLDYASIKKLATKVDQWYVALGVGRHLAAWGIKLSLIKEFDWWEAEKSHDIEWTFTPSRHFSGRGVNDRAKSLWGGWSIRTPDHHIYWSGDGGYGDHFKDVGDKLGAFDIGFMECGQYNQLWHHIHMFPEESVQAALDAKIKKAVAVHWGGFALAQHTWKDPIKRFMNEANNKDLELLMPRIGEQFQMDSTTDKWWLDIP